MPSCSGRWPICTPKPTEDADVVSQAIYGANVQMMEQREGWAHVRTADEYTGWIPLCRAPFPARPMLNPAG